MGGGSATEGSGPLDNHLASPRETGTLSGGGEWRKGDYIVDISLRKSQGTEERSVL